MPDIFNTRLRQVMLLALIILMGVLLISTLYVFLPGLLGGVTLYILARKYYFRLTVSKKWRKGLTALLFIIVLIVAIAIPLYLSVMVISPKITWLIDNQKIVADILESISQKFKHYTGRQLWSDASAQSIATKLFSWVPSFLNSTANVLSNIGFTFFLLYYFLCSGVEMEKYLRGMLPLSPESIDKLAGETDSMVKASALGIPLVSLAHGVVAGIGFLILGIKGWLILAFLTAVFAFLPIVGIMVVWVPVVVYLSSIDQVFQATGLLIYSIAITGNVDYITRLGLLRKLGNIHPIVTVFGVIVGLKLFGFMGLIFGPLLISYFVLLVKIYTKEFSD
jgi:predicted PurR-regulated permease PerM